ncbi:MAG: choice-of-anchor P family protein [Candidatus Sulfotelmatobacter sp.]|jgi:hypothetical protein
MSAVANQTPRVDRIVRTFKADAFAFSADVQAPIQKTIEKQASVCLPPTGGYDYKAAEPNRIDGIVSYGGGYAQVGGYTNADGTVITLATAVLEELNILDVLTCDRIVAQITTEHAPNSLVPSVSFLGTRFDNLRIAGQEIGLEPYHDILGAKPDNDESYLNDGGVLSRIAQQYSKIRSTVGVPKWASDQFNWDPAAVDRQQVKCSLVKSVSGAPGKSFGHVIDVPFFGRIFLAELTIKRVVKPAPKAEPGSAGPRLETLKADTSSNDSSGTSSSGTSSTGYQITVTGVNAQLSGGGASGSITGSQADPNGNGGKG